jgi:lipoprotein NlpI
LAVPPEEKFDALYSFVLGLFQKAKGDFGAAKKSFEKAFNLDANLIQARREISILAQKSQKKDVMNRDLKDLVSDFFKKR